MIVGFALLFVIGKIFFFGGLGVPGMWGSLQRQPGTSSGQAHSSALEAQEFGSRPRALGIAESVSQVLRREEREAGAHRLPSPQNLSRSDDRREHASTIAVRTDNLGEHLRLPEARRYARQTQAGLKRDLR